MKKASLSGGGKVYLKVEQHIFNSNDTWNDRKTNIHLSGTREPVHKHWGKKCFNDTYQFICVCVCVCVCEGGVRGIPQKKESASIIKVTVARFSTR